MLRLCSDSSRSYPATARHSLGTAVCGPAGTVVWRPGEKNPRLSDCALVVRGTKRLDKPE